MVTVTVKIMMSVTMTIQLQWQWSRGKFCMHEQLLTYLSKWSGLPSPIRGGRRGYIYNNRSLKELEKTYNTRILADLSGSYMNQLGKFTAECINGVSSGAKNAPTSRAEFSRGDCRSWLMYLAFLQWLIHVKLPNIQAYRVAPGMTMAIIITKIISMKFTSRGLCI